MQQWITITSDGVSYTLDQTTVVAVGAIKKHVVYAGWFAKVLFKEEPEVFYTFDFYLSTGRCETVYSSTQSDAVDQQVILFGAPNETCTESPKSEQDSGSS